MSKWWPEVHSQDRNTANTPVVMQRRQRHQAMVWGLLVLGLGGMLGVSFLVSPDDIDEGRVALTPACPTKQWFGMPCPTCGMSRAFASLSRGQWGEAMRYNRASPIVYVLTWTGLVWGSMNSLMSLHKARRFRKKDVRR
ncbi:MAG TPA: DUF2752 domain-containing protein [Polyangiaceae bacterium]|jgi:hypothetical protein|nr:MAG: hypothetical protein BWY17_05054 [Deltaproteobacteria bacterium ADurb.Bin207]HNS98895.1 DUF2752 domain-containing protein [Polyangiaceae bacterium]HNZ25393.1 DUF2752 domain-containing protein [Polyangiaceae bacterium]HOD25218.1 DUF2752 domain-containing protein [Polyangiaceae bacterium]HOE51121.1 DUF2752 domain-containing protein [Polyangiaceae bacterium]